MKNMKKAAIFSLTFLLFSARFCQAKDPVLTVSKTDCLDQIKKAPGHINYKKTFKAGNLGYHHCDHAPLKSADFSREVSACLQVDMAPEVVAISPPLPYDEKEFLPMYGRPNPYYKPNGSVCEVSYVQYYYHP